MSLKKTVIKTPTYRNRTAYHGMLVGAAAMLASALLVMGNVSTKDVIALRLAEDVQAMLSEVIPSNFHDNNLLDNKITVKNKEVYQALLDNDVSAVAFQVAEPGYSGVITLIMGVNTKGEVLGVRVVSHTETPGLGDKMETARSDWIYNFDNLALTEANNADWGVTKDGGTFDQFTGATITPRAIVKAVKEGMIFFQANKETLLSLPVEQPEVTTDGQ